MFWANSSTICWACASIIFSGMSISEFLTISSITLLSFSAAAASFFLATRPFLMSALYSANVSNSETSWANSSSTFGYSLTLISLIVTLNIAGFPASSFAWYSSGNVTLTSTSSPTFLPTSWSSNVSINECDPIVNG